MQGFHPRYTQDRDVLRGSTPNILFIRVFHCSGSIKILAWRGVSINNENRHPYIQSRLPNKEKVCVRATGQYV
jgi:hypothetical protein